MATALSLSPLFRQSVGFDRFNDLFENVETQSKPSFPPYDIVKTGENDYQIVMAVAGYNDSDINITIEDERLKVTGKHESTTNEEETTEEVTYLHRGIAKRSFEQTFRLADNMKVKAADLTNGLLTLSVYREVPEEKKPQSIQINRKTH